MHNIFLSMKQDSGFGSTYKANNKRSLKTHWNALTSYSELKQILTALQNNSLMKLFRKNVSQKNVWWKRCDTDFHHSFQTDDETMNRNSWAFTVAKQQLFAKLVKHSQDYCSFSKWSALRQIFLDALWEFPKRPENNQHSTWFIIKHKPCMLTQSLFLMQRNTVFLWLGCFSLA